MLALKDRQSHLAAMGIHQWYARTKLAGAQPTPDWVLLDSAILIDEPDTKQLVSPSIIEQKRSTPKSELVRSKSAIDILGELDSPDERSNRQVHASSIQQADAVSVAKLENLPSMAAERALDSFSLVLYKTRHGLILSESVSGQSHPAELTLLKNILRSKPALAAANADCLYHQQFNWPVFRSLNLQSKQDRELPSLMASWVVSHCSENLKSVLYFGSSFPEVNRFYAELISTTNNAICINTFKYSLAELIQFPQRKAEIWADICLLYGE